MRSSRARRLAAVLGAALVVTTAPVSAWAFGSQDTVCTGSIQEGFSSAIGVVPITSVNVSISTPAPLSCAGEWSGTATINGSGSNPLTSCGGPISILSGTATVTLSSGTSGGVTWVASGTMAAQSWLFLQQVTSPTVEALGSGAWTSIASDIAKCVPPPTLTSITLTAVIVVVA